MYLKDKLKNRVKAELVSRINKGYKNINLDSIELEIDKALRELGMEWMGGIKERVSWWEELEN